VDDCTLHIMEIPSQLYACDNCSVVYLRILDLYLGPRPAANDCTNCTLWNSFSASGMVEHNSLQCPSGVLGRNESLHQKTLYITVGWKMQLYNSKYIYISIMYSTYNWV
jgi:hypothetical protein